MKERLLDRFVKVNSVDQIPKQGTFFVLSRSTTFIGKSIQGFMRMLQWLHITKDTDHIPNHADIVSYGQAIGALEKGVEKHPVEKHFKSKKGTEYFIINIEATKAQKNQMWKFALEQVGKPYRYFDLWIHIKQVVTRVWYGKDEDIIRDKWTCYSLVASSYEYVMQTDLFKDTIGITPYDFCKIVDEKQELFN